VHQDVIELFLQVESKINLNKYLKCVQSQYIHKNSKRDDDDVISRHKNFKFGLKFF
jgi:hypothetical protein